MHETRARGIGSRLLRLVGPAAVAALLAVSACSSDQTGPSNPGSNPPPATPRLQDPVSLVEMVGDATERVLPSLPESSERDALAVSLQQLSNAVAAGAVTPVQSALVKARSSIAQYAVQVSDDEVAEAELDAIRLSLDAIEEALAEAIAQ